MEKFHIPLGVTGPRGVDLVLKQLGVYARPNELLSSKQLCCP